MIGSNLLNYRILEQLGEGGQGTVYKALDEKLNRVVVIKVLAPELMAREANLKRFEREAQLASSLDHPNICTIYALHEAEGLHFIVMQYVEGRNVRELVNGRPLELPSALSIAYQTADALAAAHSRGVIPRDIQAGNVMVTKTGLVKVLDFGLAKLVDETAAAKTNAKADMHLTEMGVPYGSATYAAPEPATGGRVDHRADIFSTGVLLYEMLAGTWPFRGQTSVEVRYAVLHDTPRPVAEVRTDNPPPSVQRILDRAMAKDPRDRYQKIAEFRDDVREARREIGADTGVAEIHGSVAPVPPRHAQERGSFGRTFRRWLRSLKGAETQPTSVPPGSTRPQGSARSTAPNRQQPPAADAAHLTQGGTSLKSIAILPFRNLSNDPAVNFYEFSLADAVITELARLRSLVVRPSSMIVKYQGKEVDPREAGSEMSVGAVLSSSFLRVGERLRVNVQLLDVQSGDILWSDRIDATADDLIAVQDTIAQRIADGLRVEQSDGEKLALGSHSTRSAAAYDEYLRGRDCHGKFVYHTLAREDSDDAIRHFQRAIEIDPDFALAHCALGGAYSNRVIKGFGGPEDYRRAEEEFNVALQMDPQLLEARLHMIFIFLSRGEKPRARAWVEILMNEAPNDVGVQFVNATLARLDGRYRDALDSFHRMLRLNPAERVVVSYNRARIFMYQGRYDDALAELDQGAAQEPNHPLVKTFQAVVLNRRGQTDEAINILREVLARHPRMDGI
ncbi:MAG TPA: protein kinase, partial [Pyrinomonadaceae bacterium]|nr:protein kinase [Pyrinomonadaceae bacterium]